jgi:hypothetical protein
MATHEIADLLFTDCISAVSVSSDNGAWISKVSQGDLIGRGEKRASGTE